MSIAAVILAAGASTRLGEPKQLVRLGGETLLERTLRVAREAGLSPAVVVLGARAAEIAVQCDLRAAQVVRCERWAEGMSQPLAAGIRAVADTKANSAVVLTADMPFVTAEHLVALCRRKGEVRASSYGGVMSAEKRNGVPAHFPRAAFASLLALEGDAGARSLLSSAVAIDLGADALDIDTPADLEAARERFAAARRKRKGAR